jgi:anti-anti-sigma regulatory factor
MADTTFAAALLSPEDGEATASFAGSITDDAAVTFAAVLNDALAAEPRRLVVSLRHAQSLDAHAVAVLHAAARHADAKKINLVVREPDAALRDRLTRLQPQSVTIEPH